MIWTHLTVFIVGIVVGWGITQLTASPKVQADVDNPPQETLASLAPMPAPHSDDLIDDLKEKLQCLEIAYQMALEMGQFKAGFLARTSHELRSPLNSIMSLQQLILTDLCDSPEEEREFVSQSYAAAQKLLALLNETTNVSKLEEGTVELSPESLSLGEILGELESLTHLQALNRNLKLIVVQPSPDIHIMGDHYWLRQVLINLVTTAIYQMNQGTIQVTAQKDTEAGKAFIYFEDGRSPTDWSEPIDLLSRLSKPKDLDSARMHKPSDSHLPKGLNFAITQIMLEKMDGTLSLLSTPVMSLTDDHAMFSGTASSELENPQGTKIQCSLPLAI